MAKTMETVTHADQFPWKRMALEELNDDPKKRQNKLNEMKNKIEAYMDKHDDFQPLMDDEFLLAFLRTRKFNVKKAFSALESFYKIHTVNPEMLFPVGVGIGQFVDIVDRGLFRVLSKRNPSDGTMVILISLKNFNVSTDDVSDILNVIFLLCVTIVKSVAFQTLGVRVIIDIANMSMSFFTTLLKRFYNIRAIILAQGCVPTRIKGIHIMNEYYGMVKQIYNLVWPFLSAKMRKRVIMHGTNYKGMHQHIDPEILPADLGGSAPEPDQEWLKQIMLDHNDEAVMHTRYGFTES